MPTIILPPGSNSADLQAAINNAMPGVDEVIVVSSDMVFISEVIIPSSRIITLVANGNWMLVGSFGSAFIINGILNLGEGNSFGGSLTITGFTNSAIRVEFGGELNMYDGEISGNTSDGGGGVFFNGSIFNMYGGEISGNTAEEAGGVYAGSIFNMYGGEIRSNTVHTHGGGVLAASEGIFTMYGGKITGNTATWSGGGVVLQRPIPPINNNFTMYDGEISGNTAGYFGGGIFASDSILAIYGGSISDNIAGYFGGGVVLVPNEESAIGSILTMYGGAISNNTAGEDGGGVFASAGGIFAEVFTMHNGEINGNTADGNGGGVWIAGVFTMYGGTISSNGVGKNGGGIYLLAESSANISGASYIINNIAANGEGGGIYTEDFIDYANLTLDDYQNITTAASTVFRGNIASQAYYPPEIATSYTNIQYARTSLIGATGYINPINNYDINFVGDHPFREPEEGCNKLIVILLIFLFCRPSKQCCCSKDCCKELCKCCNKYCCKRCCKHSKI